MANIFNKERYDSEGQVTKRLASVGGDGHATFVDDISAAPHVTLTGDALYLASLRLGSRLVKVSAVSDAAADAGGVKVRSVDADGVVTDSADLVTVAGTTEASAILAFDVPLNVDSADLVYVATADGAGVLSVGVEAW